jgi:hypothetical protein
MGTLKSLLRKALENSSPMDDLVSVVRDLAQYEQRYGMESAAFSERFQRGEMGDALDYVRWATKYRMYEEMRAEIESVFDVLEQYALPVAA